MKKDCYGCEVDHPSQRQHACLYPPEPGYFRTNFDQLAASLLSWDFIPALKYTLEKTGLNVEEARVEGAADAFLYNLKPEEDILEKAGEIIHTYVRGDTERVVLLDEFLAFWNP